MPDKADRVLTHLSLFTGIGGLDLSAEWAGFQTVGQCEWAPYPTKILEKHWPDVPRWRDIKTLTGDNFYEWTGVRTVTVISGGFPCQPFSSAGKRRGDKDDRYLWPEMFRVISEIRPRWIVGENVVGIVHLALDRVLSDLEGIGYACQTFIIPACAVGAQHRRDRVAIVAADSDCFGCGRRGGQQRNDGNRTYPNAKRQTGWGKVSYSTVPPVWNQTALSGDLRKDYGVSDWVDRIKSLGNAVVPQQFYPIFRAIYDIERMTGHD